MGHSAAAPEVAGAVVVVVAVVLVCVVVWVVGVVVVDEGIVVVVVVDGIAVIVAIYGGGILAQLQLRFLSWLIPYLNPHNGPYRRTIFDNICPA